MEDVDLVRRLGRRRLVALDVAGDHLGGEMAARRLVPALAAQPAVPDAVFRRRPAAADRAALRDEGHGGRVRARPAAGRREAPPGARDRRPCRLAVPRRDADPACCARWPPIGASARCSAITPDRAGFRLPVRAAADGPGRAAISAVGCIARSGDFRAAVSRSSAATFPMPGRTTSRAAFRALGSAHGSVRPGSGRRLLAGGAVAAPAGAAVRRGALVDRARAGRHAGEFRRAACRHAAHAARRGYGGRSALVRRVIRRTRR